MKSILFSFSGLFLPIVFSSSSYSLSSSTINKGPPTADKKEMKRIVRLGDDVKLECPISGHSTLIIDWFKDQESITDYGWSRFRTSRKSLKISKASLEDSGVYYCKGINGFGSELIKIDLIVIDPSEFPDLEEGELPNVSPPKWSSSTKLLSESVFKSNKERLFLSCEAEGTPTPSVFWYFRQKKLSSERHLNLKELSEFDSGVYTCIAKNVIGSISKNFTVSVSKDEQSKQFGSGRGREYTNDDSIETDDLISPVYETEKISVEEGQDATLECKVNSATEPKIKWLKRLEKSESENYKDVIEVGEHKYIILQSPSTSVLKSPKGEYYSHTLKLTSVSLSDSGMYYCFIANLHDVEFKNSYLTVFPKSSDGTELQNGLPEPHLYFLFSSLALFVFLFLLFLSLWCLFLQRRNNLNNLHNPNNNNIGSQSGCGGGHGKNGSLALPSVSESPELIENLMTSPVIYKCPLPFPPSPYYGLQTIHHSYSPPPPSIASNAHTYEVPKCHRVSSIGRRKESSYLYYDEHDEQYEKKN